MTNLEYIIKNRMKIDDIILTNHHLILKIPTEVIKELEYYYPGTSNMKVAKILFEEYYDEDWK